jgi:hypothetical protein
MLHHIKKMLRAVDLRVRNQRRFFSACRRQHQLRHHVAGV